jgi:hypothetical protein
MRIGIGARTARTPSGQEWRIGRRWSGRHISWWRKVHLGPAWPGDAADAVFATPDLGGFEDLGIAVVAPLATSMNGSATLPVLL